TYKTRKNVIARTIEMKQQSGENDVDYWVYLDKVFSTLGPDGTSSDESDSEGGGFRVKAMPWRRNIDAEIKIVESQRSAEGIKDNRGSEPKPRFRGPPCKDSTRKKAPQHLPPSFYNADWLNDPKVGAARRELVQPSKEDFSWMIACIRSDPSGRMISKEDLRAHQARDAVLNQPRLELRDKQQRLTCTCPDCVKAGPMGVSRSAEAHRLHVLSNALLPLTAQKPGPNPSVPAASAASGGQASSDVSPAAGTDQLSSAIVLSTLIDVDITVDEIPPVDAIAQELVNQLSELDLGPPDTMEGQIPSSAPSTSTRFLSTAARGTTQMGTGLGDTVSMFVEESGRDDQVLAENAARPGPSTCLQSMNTGADATPPSVQSPGSVRVDIERHLPDANSSIHMLSKEERHINTTRALSQLDSVRTDIEESLQRLTTGVSPDTIREVQDCLGRLRRRFNAITRRTPRILERKAELCEQLKLLDGRLLELEALVPESTDPIAYNCDDHHERPIDQYSAVAQVSMFLVTVCTVIVGVNRSAGAFMLATISTILTLAFTLHGRQLKQDQERVLADIPSTVDTVLSKFKLDGRVTTYATCSECHAIYAPHYEEGSADAVYPAICTSKTLGSDQICGAPLTETDNTGGDRSMKPLRSFVMHNYEDYMAGLLARHDIESLMDKACDDALASLDRPRPEFIRSPFEADFIRTFEGPTSSADEKQL
ncbi:hypothetical protein GLOTRDRAFT_97339, partial [Gloeophyllum trabeum ATCC 11539]